ncbi:hypothetical protein DP130_11670 [Clostridium tetani]|uniref:Serine protease n=1 Tax=Clostridium tetani TaxID=1513 RepID=A0A4Q0VBP0_CLOTA|nr:S8 family serine peptidase [Clostridium tetani]RXI45704.1 hypothetical protein DP130_11670 [Clostridium tetani]
MQKRFRKIKILLSIILIFTYTIIPFSNVRAALYNEKVRVIIEIDGDSTLDIVKDNNISRSEAAKYTDKVKEEQESIINNVEKLGGKVRYTFQNVINGLSVDINSNKIENLKRIPKVKNVSVVRKYQVLLNTSKDIVNVKSVINRFNIKGEGTVVSVIDSGIDHTHKDMKIKDLSKIKIKKEDIKEGPGKWFSNKIPYGYNFADDNFEIIDKTASMHGMHVAGIIGANGNENEAIKNKAVIGVAPEAQLLAMKVFSNKPDNKAAFSDDITAAIEDSVKKGADVINMSLGSDAGFVDSNDPEQKAIKSAVESGVIVVVAAGNSAYSTNPDYPYMEDVDTGNISSPGLWNDSLQVASMNNAKMICKAFQFKSNSEQGKIPYYISEVDPVGNLKGQFEIVDCNYGKKEEFKDKNVVGKIVLISKGHISYSDKKLNAQNAGAAGVIVYNSEEDDSYVNMPIDPKVKIPAIFINNSDGENLKKLIDKNVNIEFNNEEVEMSNSKKDISGFSSWGCAPDLGFKPEVTAPGGNIYSTINNNKYETKSGTSMASPHVAGTMALLVQYLKSNNNINLNNSDFVNLTKNLIINTAEPLMDKKANGLPYLTRQQGAGLIQIDKTLKSNVILTGDNDKAVIELKEVENNKNFKLKLKNLSDRDISFKISDKYGVLTNQTYYSDNFKRNCLRMRAEKLNGAKVSFDKKEVTVPAKGEALINAELFIKETTMPDIFVEGFITLESKDNEQPNIGIPYMGFYGKWDNPRIFDAPMWEESSFYGLTALLDSSGASLGGYYDKEKQREDVNTEYISISPNNDKSFDEVSPHVAFLRNAKEFKIEILDDNKKTVRNITYEKNIRKNNGISIYPMFSKSWKWDGELYNSYTGKMEIAKEGQYYMRLSGKIDFEGAKVQHLDIPIKIDLTPPKIHCETEKIGKNNYKIKFNGSDNVAIKKYCVYFNDEEEPKYEFDGDKTFGEIKEVYEDIKVTVKAIDFAGNCTCEDIFNSKIIEIQDIPKYTNKKDFIINYSISNDVDYVEITVDNNKINNGKNNSYNIKELTDGEHEIKLEAYNKEGKSIYGEKLSFIVDTKSPQVEMVSPIKDIEEIIDGQSSYLIKFNVKEELPYNVYINNQKIFTENKGTFEGKDFKYDFSLASGENKVNIKIEDVVGNTTEKKFILKTLEDNTINIINIKNGETILGKSLQLSGIVKDAYRFTELKVNDNKVELDNKGSFNCELDFESYGSQQIVLEGKALKGKDYRKILNVDLSPIKFDKENYYIKGRSIDIPYNLDKNNKNINEVEIVVDNKIKLQNNKDKNTIKIERLFEGKHNIVFNVLDKNKKIIGTKSVIVNIDNINPTVVELKDEEGNDLNQKFIFNKDAITLLGELSEFVEVLKINGENVKVVNTNDDHRFSKEIKLKEGLNLVRFEIKDRASNTTEYVTKIYSDTKAPILKVKPDGDKILLKGEKQVNLNIIGEDNTFGYKLYINDSLVDKVYNELGDGKNTKKEFNHKVSVLGDKAIVKVKLVDLAGNISEKIIQFYREDKKDDNIDKEDFIITNMTVNKSFKNGEQAKVRINITNNKTIDKEASLIIGLYDVKKNKMVDYVYVNKNIKSKDSSKLEAGFQIPREGQYLIKTMVWDNIKEINYISSPIELLAVK